jgi:dipeptidyl-peptidase-4
VLVFSLSLSLMGQKKPITADSLYQATRLSEGGPGAPVWAPDGKTFVFLDKGKLNLYNPASQIWSEVIEPATLENAAAKFDSEGAFEWQNRRVKESTVQWSASGKELLYLAGGDLFLIHLDTRKWDQLTHTPVAEHDPKLSPDGKTVSFRRGWDLYTLDLATGHETRLTTDGSDTLRNGGLDWVYPEELDLRTAYWWSPDSKSIAYLQFDISHEPVYPHEDLLGAKAIYEPERYPQAGDPNAEVKVGVIDLVHKGHTKWMDVGETGRTHLIARAGWMPDSAHVYVVRLTREQHLLELLSYAIHNGMGSVILRESDLYWVNLHGDPRFLMSGQFLWLSERDGFTHLYLCSADGKEQKQLTQGQWEVSNLVGVDEAAGRVYFLSSEVSPLERQFYSIGLDGGNKTRLSKSAGTHSISMEAGGPYYLDTFSNLTAPPRTTIHKADGSELGTYRYADTRLQEQFNLVPAEFVKYQSAGLQFYAKLIKPEGFDPAKKYPAIVMVYGGPGVQQVVDRWSNADLAQMYAQAGYVVWSLDNRGSIGRGHGFETPIYHRLGEIELEDQKTGVGRLVAMGFVDPKRVGVYGWSYGGFMTLNALLNAPDLFRCGIAGAPVTSWQNYDTIYTERYMGLPSENQDGYKDTALLPQAEHLASKLMLVHNFEDDNVLFQNTVQMMNALEQADKQFEFKLYPQKTHGVTGSVTGQMYAGMVDFFDRCLK